MIDVCSYKALVDSFHDMIVNVPEKIAGIKLAADKWSLKEIIGHLIDSASNNHQRFVRLQFDDLLNFPPYDGELWVKTQKYHDMNWSRIVLLWHNYNCMLINIIGCIESGSLSNVWVKGEDEVITLEALIVAYYRHMEVHIKQFDDRLKETEGG